MNESNLMDMLISYSREGRYPLHMPGHKRNRKLLEGMDPFDVDITEIEGFDNLHYAQGILKDCMERARAFYGTRRSWFLVNGSTCGLLAAVCAVTEIGDTVLVGRNCHKSVYHALKLRNLRAEYIYPEWIGEYGIYGGYDAEKIREMLDKNSWIKVVIVTSPTYEGMVSDIQKIAEIVHERGGILIVDEAHGAHFGLCEKSPKPAYRLGADIVVESLHKTLPAMTQTAVLHLTGNQVNVERIEEFLGVFETSSPSYVLMASIDRCIHFLADEGKEKMEHLLRQMHNLRSQAKSFRHIRIPDRELIGQSAVFDVDETKLIFDVSRTELTGRTLAKQLRTKYGFEPEMEALTYALGICTVCDDDAQLERLVHCLGEIDKTLCFKEKVYDRFLPESKARCSIYEASVKETETVKISAAEGRISAEFLYLYPPGIPLVVPGEEISQELAERVQDYIRQGFCVNGLADRENKQIQVLR